MNKAIVLAVVALATLSGCATKHYGRQGELTDYEKLQLNCREVDIELAKIDGFLKRVDDESSFDMLSVFSFIGDLGLGNVVEKRAAVKSATERRKQLREIRMLKGCAYTTVMPSTPSVAAPPSQPYLIPSPPPPGLTDN